MILTVLLIARIASHRLRLRNAARMSGHPLLYRGSIEPRLSKPATVNSTRPSPSTLVGLPARSTRLAV